MNPSFKIKPEDLLDTNPLHENFVIAEKPAVIEKPEIARADSALPLVTLKRL